MSIDERMVFFRTQLVQMFEEALNIPIETIHLILAKNANAIEELGLVESIRQGIDLKKGIALDGYLFEVLMTGMVAASVMAIDTVNDGEEVNNG